MDEPEPQTDAEPARLERPPIPTPESREALWRLGGLERDGDGLAELSRDPHPLVRLIAGSALRRTESRGAHLRLDFPERNPELDGVHVVAAPGEPARFEAWS